MSEQSSDGTERTPSDPFDPDDAMHVDEFPPFNGDDKASFAFDDDGTRYKVTSGDRFPSTKFLPESQWRETFMPERDGVGEECSGCGEPIEWNAVIVNSEYHIRCYVGTDTDRQEDDL